MKKHKITSPRQLSLEVLVKVERQQGFAQNHLDYYLEKNVLNAPDRRLAVQLTIGVLRWRNKLDWVIEQWSHCPTAKMNPWARNILRLGVYQLMFLNRIPAYAAVNETVSLAHHYTGNKLVKFTNAILRQVETNLLTITFPEETVNPAKYLSIEYAHPEWLVKRWLRQYGRKYTSKLCAANNEIPPLTIRTNTLKISRAELIKLLAEEEIKSDLCRFAPEGLLLQHEGKITLIASFREGSFQVQDESSMLVSHLLAPQPGELILDFCAGPGGKTTHLATLSQGEGTIIAIEKNHLKLEKVRENCKRLGIHNVEFLQQDARRVVNDFNQKADKVLVDSPCSNLGVIRRRPEVKWRIRQEDILRLSKLQQEILLAASQCVRPGGILVYSVCTFSPGETKEVIKDFLKKQPEWKIDQQLPPQLVTLATDNKLVYTYPHLHNLDGMFMVRLIKERK